MFLCGLTLSVLTKQWETNILFHCYITVLNSKCALLMTIFHYLVIILYDM